MSSLPSSGDVHVNVPLTQISIAYIQQAKNFIAARVFPNIPVSKQSDRYYTYERGDFNRSEMIERAPGAETTGSGYRIDNTPTYYAPVYGVHKDVPDQVRNNADSVLNPDKEATIWVTQQGLLKREKLWVGKYFKDGIWSFERTGVASSPNATQVLHWNDGNSTPIENVRLAKTSILEDTGFEPNTLVIGQRVYDALADHPDIIDRIKYSGGVGNENPARATVRLLAQLFEVERVLISKAIENTAGEGLNPAHSFIAGKHALLCYSAPEPGLMTPSAGYTFSWTGHLGAGAEGGRIKQFRLEQIASDRVELEMAFDQKLVAADLGFFFNGIVV